MKETEANRIFLTQNKIDNHALSKLVNNSPKDRVDNAVTQLLYQSLDDIKLTDEKKQNQQDEDEELTQMHPLAKHIHFPKTWALPCIPLPKHEDKAEHKHHMQQRHAMGLEH